MTEQGPDEALRKNTRAEKKEREKRRSIANAIRSRNQHLVYVGFIGFIIGMILLLNGVFGLYDSQISSILIGSIGFVIGMSIVWFVYSTRRKTAELAFRGEQ